MELLAGWIGYMEPTNCFATRFNKNEITSLFLLNLCRQKLNHLSKPQNKKNCYCQQELSAFLLIFNSRYIPKGQYSICGETRGCQQCIFDYFLTKQVGVNENLGVERYQRGVKPPNPIDKSNTA